MLSLQHLISKATSFGSMEPSQSIQCVSQNMMTAATAESGDMFMNRSYQHLASSHRGSKWLCFLTTCLVFAFGVGVGIALPVIYASSSVVNEINNSTLLASWSIVQDSSTMVHLPFNLTSTKRNMSSIPIPVRKSARMKAHFNKKQIEIQQSTRQALDTKEPILTDVNSTNDVEAVTVDVVSFVQPQTSWVPAGNEDGRNVTTVLGEAVKGIFWSNVVEDILPIVLHKFVRLLAVLTYTLLAIQSHKTIVKALWPHKPQTFLQQ